MVCPSRARLILAKGLSPSPKARAGFWIAGEAKGSKHGRGRRFKPPPPTNRRLHRGPTTWWPVFVPSGARCPFPYPRTKDPDGELPPRRRSAALAGAGRRLACVGSRSRRRCTHAPIRDSTRPLASEGRNGGDVRPTSRVDRPRRALHVRPLRSGVAGLPRAVGCDAHRKQRRRDGIDVGTCDRAHARGPVAVRLPSEAPARVRTMPRPRRRSRDAGEGPGRPRIAQGRLPEALVRSSGSRGPGRRRRGGTPVHVRRGAVADRTAHGGLRARPVRIARPSAPAATSIETRRVQVWRLTVGLYFVARVISTLMHPAADASASQTDVTSSPPAVVSPARSSQRVVKEPTEPNGNPRYSGGIAFRPSDAEVQLRGFRVSP